MPDIEPVLIRSPRWVSPTLNAGALSPERDPCLGCEQPRQGGLRREPINLPSGPLARGPRCPDRNQIQQHSEMT